LIVGSGPEEAWLRSEFGSHVERGVVQFVGALSSNDVQRFYETIHVLLVTSQWETGPIVAWEAMAHGALVVTSAYIGSGLEGNLRHGENCLMYSLGDAAAAAECISKVHDTELRIRVISGAFDLAREKMTQERSIEYWSNCFADIKCQP